MMNEGKENIIETKSYHFALEIVRIYKTLTIDKKEYVLSKQILSSGTSVAANIHEAIASESKKDFIHKLRIALIETRGTAYWLNLLKDSDYICKEEFKKLISLTEEILKILNSINLTTKKRYLPN